MRILIVFLIGLVLIACATGTDRRSGAPEMWEVLLNDQEELHIASVAAEGRRLYRKDQYAARATDILLDAIDLGDYPDLVGWIGYTGEQAFTVSFYERTENQVSLVADVHFSDFDASSLKLNPDRTISEREISMLNARMAALEQGTSSCSDRFNTVVMSSNDDDDNWMVYVLAATTNPDLIVVGGHSRVRVSRASAEVLDVERLSSSCLTLDKSEIYGTEGAIVVVTHHVTPMPIPVHPFLSLLHEQPILVISERGRWLVAGHRISLM